MSDSDALSPSRHINCPYCKQKTVSVDLLTVFFNLFQCDLKRTFAL